jgi:hypothetical protein
LKRSSVLSESIHQQLNSYALAASAAGVGMLALAPPAEARIVYRPAHVSISPNSTIPLDLNHDGINDFSFSNFYAGWTNSGVGALLLKGAQGNGFWASTNSAAALPAGVSIGPQGPFRGYGAMANMFQTFGSFQSWGPWVNVKRRYLGLKYSLRLGSPERDERTRRILRHDHRIRVRDDSEQAHHHGQDEGFGCHHTETRQPRSFGSGSVSQVAFVKCSTRCCLVHTTALRTVACELDDLGAATAIVRDVELRRTLSFLSGCECYLYDAAVPP